MTPEQKNQLMLEISKVVALGLGVLAWHLLSNNSADFRKKVADQIREAMLPPTK